MKIDVSNPELYFAFFYILSFLATFILILFFSSRLKISLWSVLLMLNTVSLFTILGSRLSTIPVSQWGYIISTGKLEGYHGRFAVGGLLFGLAGLVFSQRNLGISKPIYNLYAWIAPIGFGIQKIGCFFNGCCFGRPTDMLWGVQYPVGTSVHYHQFVNGIIDERARYSLNVFPVQLLEVICLFAISYLVWHSQKHWKRPGSALIFSISLYFIFRFSSEFLRDPASSNFNNAPVGGLNIIQWFLLISGIVCLIILFLHEKRLKFFIQRPLTSEQILNRSMICIFTVSVIIFLFRRLFTPFEMLSLNIKFIPAILFTGYIALKSIKTLRYQLATTSFLVFPLLLMTQTLLQDSTKTGTIKDFYQNQVTSYKRIDAGSSLGEYFNTLSYNPQQGECGTTYTHEDYKYVYRTAGAGFSFIRKMGESLVTTGINLYGGSNKEINLSKNLEKTYFLFGVNPYIKYDLNWVGMGVGVHLGNLRWIPVKPINETTFDKGTRWSPIMPDVYLRFGRPDILDLKYTYGFNFPTSFPVLIHEISIGSGFGYKSEFNLSLGKAFSHDYSYPFIYAGGLLGKQVGLTFKYNFGGEDFYFTNFSESSKRKGRIQFGLNYRFGFQ
jgi:phosphatidylglycerol:prolipoprotein diacylglycerol transferase